MTWFFDPSQDTIDVYDQDGTLVAEDRPLPEGDRSWADYPDEVLVVMREAFETGGPTSYNQALLRDAATEQIEEGTP